MMFETAAVMSVAEISSGRKIFSACEFLLEELSKKAYRVEKISVVIENVGVIAHELEFLTKQFDIVAIIGRLNSNFILQGIAKICDEQLVSRHTSFSGIELLPPAAKCLACNASTLPLVYLQRVFILDVDHIEALTSCLLRHIEQYRSKPKFKKTFSTQKILNGILNSLEVGRGVTLTRHEKRDTIVLENNDFHIFVECERILRKELGDVNDICDNSDVLEIIYKSNDGYIQRALEHIRNCLKTYDPENIFLCFNGGKDCTVLLHLIYTVLKFDYPAYKDPLFCMYVRSSEVFPEQEKFISQCQIYYNLDVMSVSLGIKESLEKVLELKPNLKACFMGTRSTDPFSQDLTVFQVTDPSWPQVMRVSPLLEWHYSDIWDYLLFYKVPYCSLYDKGYTSLGSAANTVRNPCLSFFDVRLGKETYLPAYKLFNEAEERNGRNVLQ